MKANGEDQHMLESTVFSSHWHGYRRNSRVKNHGLSTMYFHLCKLFKSKALLQNSSCFVSPVSVKLFLGTWKHCDCFPWSVSARQVSPWSPSYKTLPSPLILVIYHQLWSRVLYHLCESAQGSSNICPCEERGMTLLRVLAGPGTSAVQRAALASAQLCTSLRAVPRAGLVLSGNWNSHRSLETATVFLENVLFYTFTPLLLPLSVKQCYLIFHGGTVQLNFFCVSSCLSTSYLSQFGRPSRCWATETQLFVLIALNSETGNTSLYAYLQF